MKTIIRTADLCDLNLHSKIPPDAGFQWTGLERLRHFTPLTTVFGKAAVVSLEANNEKIKAAVGFPGKGRILFVDNPGHQITRAVVGGGIAKRAQKNGWGGIVVNGFVRDQHELARLRNIAVMAFGTAPMGVLSDNNKIQSFTQDNLYSGRGVTVEGVSVSSGNHAYIDDDGIVVTKKSMSDHPDLPGNNSLWSHPLFS